MKILIIRRRTISLLLLSVIFVICGAIVFFKKSAKPAFSQNAKTKHLVVISIDALNAQDFDEMNNLPNIKKLIDNGSYAKEVVGIYPSLTYPSHTSIITGVYPDKHGIYTNERCEPGTYEQEWYWYRKDVKVPTLYDIAKAVNMKVGSLFWPVTGGANIDYLLAEIWPVKKTQNQIWMTLSSGSPFFILDINNKFGDLRDGKKQPQLDNFAAASAEYMMRTKKPNLSLIHFTELDHERHKHGVMSQEAEDALKRMDDRVGQIIQGTKDGGIYEDTTFVILGDHGFLDVDYKICLNVAFRKAGLITVNSKGELTDWKAYANYCDGSAQIVLKDNNDKDTEKKVKMILEALSKDSSSGIEAVYTKEEGAKKRVTGNFIFMVEGKEGYYFANDWNLDSVVNKIDINQFDEYNESFYIATHGYDPLKNGYRTFFMASGASIKKGVVLPSINLVDEGPTMAEILGLKMDNTDGRVLYEMILNN